MKVHCRLLALGIVTALALPLLSKTAHAASVSGWSGKVPIVAQATCFDSQGAGVINDGTASQCFSTPFPYWDIPLLITSGGSHTVRIYANQGGQGGSCTLYGFQQNGQVTSQQSASLPNNGVFSLTVSVPSTQGSSLLIRCNLGNNAMLESVDYNM